MIQNVSRRHFLGGIASTGAFILAARVLPESVWAQESVRRSRAESSALSPTVYLGVNPDGTVFIVTHRSEMGTGIRTTLPLVAADELDADWSRVTIEQGLGDPKYGDQNTDGSRSIRDFYDAFRRAGASARAMLMSAAAAQWNVPVSELATENHEVLHRASGRRAGYGSLATAAGKLEVPKPETLRFKPKTAWKFIGKERPSYDLADILNGKAQFGLDVFRDGMMHASIEHPPVYGGKVKTLDDKAAKAVKGVQDIIQIDPITPPYLFKPLGGVAVIGNNTWSVLQGRKQLRIEWEDGPHGSFNSPAFRQELIATVRKPAKVFVTPGMWTPNSARAARSSRRSIPRRSRRMRRWNHPPRLPSSGMGSPRSGRPRRIRRLCRIRWRRRSGSTRRTSCATSRFSGEALDGSPNRITAPKRRSSRRSLASR